MLFFVESRLIIFHGSFADCEKGDTFPRRAWVDGVASGLLIGRAVVLQSPFEAETRKAEKVACADCDVEGISRLNPKMMEGKATEAQTCDFVTCVEVLRRGGLAPEFQLNLRRLELGGYKITREKWGNSTSAPYLMQQDVRLLKLVHNKPPPHFYAETLLLLQNDSSSKEAGIILLTPLRFDAWTHYITLTTF